MYSFGTLLLDLLSGKHIPPSHVSLFCNKTLNAPPDGFLFLRVIQDRLVLGISNCGILEHSLMAMIMEVMTAGILVIWHDSSTSKEYS